MPWRASGASGLRLCLAPAIFYSCCSSSHLCPPAQANKEGPRLTIYKTTGEQYKGEWAGDKRDGAGRSSLQAGGIA